MNVAADMTPGTRLHLIGLLMAFPTGLPLTPAFFEALDEVIAAGDGGGTLTHLAQILLDPDGPHVDGIPAETRSALLLHLASH